ncbi:MAG: hypothetical protein P857_278 [Candidatus Xenolissoclinum pacificiensis L6]|uniref:ApaG domain-containing protein n=1 Tax=Candidatus Xenolissoclinum pacificiensis L6 TaxID=1401685 RepID=W2V138_9RICK|nr:MAG: hypothetical protein P857_278 [Candidatus Xenolissoclinum pacificiensis L6]
MRKKYDISEILLVSGYFNTDIEDIKFYFRVHYLGEYLYMDETCYIWTYKVMIYNGYDYDIKVLGREWNMVDCRGVKTKVIDRDILGDHPILKPSEIFEYESVIYGSSDSAIIYGYYDFLNILDNRRFSVDIPSISLDTPRSLKEIS